MTYYNIPYNTTSTLRIGFKSCVLRRGSVFHKKGEKQYSIESNLQSLDGSQGHPQLALGLQVIFPLLKLR